MKVRNSMTNFIQSIIDWFKLKFGVRIEDKTSNELMTDFEEVDGISITATLSERLASLSLSDSGIAITGNNARAEYIGSFAGKFYKTRLDDIAQVCLGTGDCIAKPNTDGHKFGIDVIKNSDFRIVSSIGDLITAVLIRCDTFKSNNELYERWEYHKLEEIDTTVVSSIYQVCFKDGKEVPISDVPQWSSIQEYQYVPNVDRLLIGRFKCPKLNRRDVNSPNGVPITYGADEIVIAAKESWRRFNQEFSDKESMIFADKTLFKTRIDTVINPDGSTSTAKRDYMPRGKERLIKQVNANKSIDGQPLIHDYSPAIRDASLDSGIERNLRMLEMFCGLSEGILSKSTLTYTNTDEVKKSTQATFAFITKFRNTIEQGVNDLLYAIDMICNANGITPMGEWSAVYEWSDTYVQSMAERFNELMQGQAVGVIGKDEFRSWLTGESIDQAKEWVEQNKGIDLINE